MPRMTEDTLDARYAHTAGWSARFLEAVPTAVLTAVLIALVGLLGWIAVSVVNLQTRVGKLETRVEEGFKQTNERLTRLEESVIDIYKLLAERLPPPQEQAPPQR